MRKNRASVVHHRIETLEKPTILGRWLILKKEERGEIERRRDVKSTINAISTH